MHLIPLHNGVLRDKEPIQRKQNGLNPILQFNVLQAGGWIQSTIGGDGYQSDSGGTGFQWVYPAQLEQNSHGVGGYGYFLGGLE